MTLAYTATKTHPYVDSDNMSVQTSPTMNVMVVHPYVLLSDLIATALRKETDVHVIGVEQSLHEVTDQLARCDILLLSAITLQDCVSESITEVHRANPAIKILITELPRTTSLQVACLEAGAVGYIFEDATVDELLRQIRAVYQGKALISEQIAAALISRCHQLAAYYHDNKPVKPAPENALTPREREVLCLISRGKTNQEIADCLVIEVGTVKNHVHNILSKLNVDNRQAAGRYWQHLKTLA